MEGKIEQGILLKVKSSFIAMRRTSITYAAFVEGAIIPESKFFDHPWYLTEGSIIEIRHPFAWHFRNTCNTYAHAPEDVLRQHCEYFGTIDPDIRFRNKHSLQEILDEKLYNPGEME